MQTPDKCSQVPIIAKGAPKGAFDIDSSNRHHATLCSPPAVERAF
jgi:hypothetical protein